MIASRTPEQEEQRRKARASWPIRRFRLGEEPSDDLSDSTTPEERLAMMWPLTVDAYSHGPGLPEPAPRATWPVRMRPLGAREVD